MEDVPIEVEETAPAEEAPPRPTEEQIAVAEEPGLWQPDEPTHMVFHGVGFSFVAHGRSAWVHRLRLPEDDDEVQRVINHVDAILSLKQLAEATWWLGELSTPGYLADYLVELGLEPDDPPEMTSLIIATPPGGEPAVEVRRAESLEDLLKALEIDWECFGISEEEREFRRREAAEAWSKLELDGTMTTYLAYLDDEPVGFGRAVFTRHGVLMLGGATLPDARGQGVYTSLVHARWQQAVDHGVPRLLVSAGALSAPILERLGFERMGKVRLLRQRVT